MTLFWFIFPIVVFVIVLSWTDLVSHVGYSVAIAKNEGWCKFPVIWFQSFFLPICFLKSGKSKIDYEAVSNMERACRLALSDTADIKIQFSTYSRVYKIQGCWDVTFQLFNCDSVEINGHNKLIPPRVAFLMLAVRDKVDLLVKTTDLKPKSLID